MPTLDLTLNPDYCKDWDVWSAIRELIQNAKDADDLGFKMEINYNESRKEPTLQIINHGTLLDRSSLLLGGTTKSDNPNARGKFGEGYKLAFLTLLRAGLSIWVRSGSEKWVPFVGESTDFNSKLLKVEITKAQTFENSIKIEVRGLTKRDWESVQERFLFSPFTELKAEKDFIDAQDDKILTLEKYRGKLFVKGIYVGDLPGRYWFGYDLFSLKLDRDRRLADPWDLRYKIKDALNKAAMLNHISEDDIYTLITKDQWEESRIVADTDWGVEALAAKVTRQFHILHGNDVVAVDSMQDAIELKHHGMNGVVVPKAIKKLVEQKDGNVEEKKQKRAYEFSIISSLSDEEEKNFLWAVNLLKSIKLELPIQVAEFVGQNVLGLHRKGEVFIAKKILLDKKELIATLAHEYAHEKGDDGTPEHIKEMENIFSRLIVEISSKEN